MLAGVFEDVYFSVRRAQADDAYYADKKVVVDEAPQGPMSGIYSALRAVKKSIFVVACDMPRISAAGISALLEARERGLRAGLRDGLVASVFEGAHGEAEFEPLFAVYEMRAERELEALLTGGACSMMKFLQSRAEAVITVPRDRAEEDSFINLNTKNDFEAYKQYNEIANF